MPCPSIGSTQREGPIKKDDAKVLHDEGLHFLRLSGFERLGGHGGLLGFNEFHCRLRSYCEVPLHRTERSTA